MKNKGLTTLLLLLLFTACGVFAQTMPSWLQLKDKPTIDPRAYGAIADDGVDDTAAILLSITSNTNANVVLPLGEYDIKTDLTIPATATLIISGGELVVATGITLTIKGRIFTSNQSFLSGAGDIVLIEFGSKDVRPEWFGATGDGTTDDSTACQQMFDSIGSDTTSILMENTYLTSSQMTVVADEDLSIDGGGTLLCTGMTNDVFDADPTNGLEFTLAATANLTVKNLTVIGPSAAAISPAFYGSLNGIFILSGDRVTLDNVCMSGWSRAGLWVDVFDHANETHVTNCRVTDSLYAGFLADSNLLTVINDCHVSDIGTDVSVGYGFIVRSDSWATLTNCGATSCTRYAYDLRGTLRGKIADSFSYNAGYAGIYAENENATKTISDLTINDCSLIGASYYGIAVGNYEVSGTVEVDAIKIDGCFIDGADVGIFIDATNGTYAPKLVSISDTKILCGSSYGIQGSNRADATASLVDNYVLNNCSIYNVAAGKVGVYLANGKNTIVTGCYVQSPNTIATPIILSTASSSLPLEKGIITSCISDVASYTSSSAFFIIAVASSTANNLE